MDLLELNKKLIDPAPREILLFWLTKLL